MAARNFHPNELVAAYDFLRETLPFRRWKLPESDDFAFHVTQHKDRFGHFDDKDGKGTPVIGVSTEHTKTYNGLLETVAHELVHIHLQRQAYRRWEKHSYKFKRLAAQVCRYHGWELIAFCGPA